MKPRNNGVEHKSLEERAAEFGGQLNLDGEFDRPPTVGRERWDEYDNFLFSLNLRINTIAKHPFSRIEHKNKAVALNHKFCAVIILKKIR